MDAEGGRHHKVHDDLGVRKDFCSLDSRVLLVAILVREVGTEFDANRADLEETSGHGLGQRRPGEFLVSLENTASDLLDLVARLPAKCVYFQSDRTKLVFIERADGRAFLAAGQGVEIGVDERVACLPLA